MYAAKSIWKAVASYSGTLHKCLGSYEARKADVGEVLACKQESLYLNVAYACRQHVASCQNNFVSLIFVVA